MLSILIKERNFLIKNTSLDKNLLMLYKVNISH